VNGARRGTAWALLAVSSEAQAGTLADQRAWAENAASENGWRLTRVVDGVATGKAGPRALVRKLLVELRALDSKDRPGYVLMTRLDRVGRGAIVDTMVVVHELRELGCRAWTREDGEIKVDSAMEELLVAVKASVAAHENAVRRDKAVAVYRRKREAGMAVGNKRPYGLTIGPDGKDVPLQTHVPAIREAFRLRAAGNGYHTVALRLAEIAPPQTFRNGRSQPVRWTQNRVLRLLENRAYVGTVVGEATFLRAQRTRKRLGQNHDRDARAVHPWPLSGALRCYCGRAMNGLLAGAPGRRIRYCGCRATWSHRGSVRLVRADALEEQFIAMLRRLGASPEQADRWRQRAATSVSPHLLNRGVREARARLAEVDRERDRLWALNASGKVRDDDVQERLDALRSRRHEAEDALRRLEEQRVLLASATKRDHEAHDLFKRAPEVFVRAAVDDQKQIARAVASTLGGLHVSRTNRIAIGPVDDPQRQRRRKSSGE
jgi:DNA invertase Pin-like site-specific DNA recombinase